jgi:hypothetical protein
MRVFVASSTQGLPEAHAIQECLESFADIVVWDQGVFDVSSYPLEALEQAARDFDCGIFVMTPDDLRTSGTKKALVPRDNVVFEIGMFIGSLGRRRSFLVVPSSDPVVKLPTDLDGLTQARYRRDRTDGNLRAALAPACEKIRRAVEKSAARKDAEGRNLTPTRLSIEPGVPGVGVREDGSVIHHSGRLPPSYTGRFLQGAQNEITIIGSSLRSFVGYFESRPEAEVRRPIVEALERGARVTILFLDPDCAAAKFCMKDRSEQPLIRDIRRSLDKARSLRRELSPMKGPRLDIRTYQQYPALQIKRVDDGTKSARLLFYHYLPSLRRPELPYFEVHRENNPHLYTPYSRVCDHLLSISKRVP